ncbi:hypothetical protein MHY_15690 [Megamonas hypermegale ART12/1]|nr:hypothetical protein MHY_15690 [Megamonas hypermegale ART12/1]
MKLLSGKGKTVKNKQIMTPKKRKIMMSKK